MLQFSKTLICTFLIGSTILVISCQNKKKQSSGNVYDNDRLYGDEFVLDNMNGIDFSGEPKPMGLDGSFDDFIFAYAANNNFQAQRTKFPLPVIDCEKGDTTWLSKETWEPDSLFTNRSFYTILYDTEEDMDIVSLPDMNRAQVEWIYLDSKTTKAYHFKKGDEMWILDNITYAHLKEYENEEFINFYEKFATDTVFQSSRLASDTLEYITSDPNDDFEILETQISKIDWENMRPMLPQEKLLNVNYGQIVDPTSPTKILAVKGIGNGFSNVFYFRLNDNGKWELFKFDDVGV